MAHRRFNTRQRRIWYAQPVATVLIGTSGYSYADWNGSFYPRGTAARDRLAYYLRHFSFVEINSTYYRPPDATTFGRIADVACAESRSPRIAVKLSGTLTHARPDDVAAEVRRFTDGVCPLAAAGCLAPIVAQFPFRFRYDRDDRVYLATLLGYLRDALDAAGSSAPIAVEFRHRSWSRASVAAGLAARGAIAVDVDLPALSGLPPSLLGDEVARPGAESEAPGAAPVELDTAGVTPPPTPRVAYVRLHGRNADRWWDGTNVTRYDYRYGEDEIAALARALRRRAASVELIHVAFNNHARGQAVENAEALRSLLRDNGDAVGPSAQFS